jgi:kynurenine formamidase
MNSIPNKVFEGVREIFVVTLVLLSVASVIAGDAISPPFAVAAPIAPATPVAPTAPTTPTTPTTSASAAVSNGAAHGSNQSLVSTDSIVEPLSLHSPANNIVDLTHVLGPDLPDFHTGSEAFHYKKVFSVEKDGYANGSFCTVEHYGTHVDAPSHFFVDGISIDKIEANKLVLPCFVIDVREKVKKDPDYRLTVDDIKAFEEKGQIPQHSAVLLLTGWASKWGPTGDYRNADDKGVMHFPGFDKDSAEYLVNKRHASCLGIDTLSIDAGTSNVYAAHKIALGNGIYMIENLNNLQLIPARGAWLITAPLKLQGGTGSPARVFALTP